MLDLQDSIRWELDFPSTRCCENRRGLLAAHVQVQRDAVNWRRGRDGALEIKHHIGSRRSIAPHSNGAVHQPNQAMEKSKLVHGRP